ncbi:MAG: hopanoid-associated sugar epimerase [Desulfatibacillaceae bacterium]
MQALVTGGTGFVGSAVIRKLLGAGHAVRALCRPGSNRGNLEGLDADVFPGDIRDPDSCREAAAGCDAVFHVAADYRLWVPRPREIYAANVLGTLNVMQAALGAGVERVVYTSSVATLGILPGGVPAEEDTPVAYPDMIGHYKRSKFLAEAEVHRLVVERGLPAVVVNPSTPVGPRDIKPTPTGRMVVQAATGGMPAYVDTGLNLAHVDDVAAGHLLALERGAVGERYILGGEDLSLREILVEVARTVGRVPPRVRLPRRPLYPLAVAAESWARISGAEPFVTVDGIRLAKKLMFFSSDKARRELGYDPRPARYAVADAIAWFSRHGYLD